ncbi:MAG: endonuclease III [Methanolinea sp.]|nr:endonuclease III [Methanolinea sp.]
MDRETACRIYSVLVDLYDDPGSPRTFLRFENPFQILVLTILSARTTDRSVNAIRDALFQRYPGPEELSAADPRDVEILIHSLGYYHEKASRIIQASRALLERYGGRVPDTMEDLLSLPGVGRKTANIVLNHAYGITAGIAVDTHVARLSKRLGFSLHDDPKKIERDLMALFPRETWGHLNYLLIRHGRSLCTARSPSCHLCPLREMCRYFGEGQGNSGYTEKRNRNARKPR